MRKRDVAGGAMWLLSKLPTHALNLLITFSTVHSRTDSLFGLVNSVRFCLAFTLLLCQSCIDVLGASIYQQSSTVQH